jgi:hypothetical protein
VLPAESRQGFTNRGRITAFSEKCSGKVIRLNNFSEKPTYQELNLINKPCEELIALTHFPFNCRR